MSTPSEPDPQDASPSAQPRPPHTERPARAAAGVPALVGALIGIALGIALIAAGSGNSSAAASVGVVVLVVVALLLPGFVVVQPNESSVVILFGRYVGTVREAGMWWLSPFTVVSRPKISLRVRNFQSERIKVNDSSGNPIEIAAVVVWRVTDTARAVFDVEDYGQFVVVQSETALRHLASQYPYDDYDQDATSLRGHTDDVRASLEAELQSRLERAGIEILETRLTHLAYAPEIAEVMLRRQQAEAILAARRTMVQGAVTLVQMALAQLADSDLIEMDPERKASMVSNLMIVLSGDHSPTPVINTGTLYS
ncbi:MAG TPA: SPFH domain-containing protein [Solirubrobacteraceae bacterium]|jgi:regulator of protease activity HflC (stomatin/prohibitin superfamily)|nr:SPFH domain-containing protein [Solirubrobacteraceae bacterium]